MSGPISARITSAARGPTPVIGSRIATCPARGSICSAIAGGDVGQVPTQPVFRVYSPGLRTTDVD
jgi:hypothetical protein